LAFNYFLAQFLTRKLNYFDCAKVFLSHTSFTAANHQVHVSDFKLPLEPKESIFADRTRPL